MTQMSNGVISHVDSMGQFHNEDGPALIFPKTENNEQCEEYFIHGVRHRKENTLKTEYPTVIFGNKRQYHKNGQLHRKNGPAVIDGFGAEEYYYNGQRHRMDGPAYINPNALLSDGSTGHVEKYFVTGIECPDKDMYDLLILEIKEQLKGIKTNE